MTVLVSVDDEDVVSSAASSLSLGSSTSSSMFRTSIRWSCTSRADDLSPAAINISARLCRKVTLSL
jgi:hypothetical protein